MSCAIRSPVCCINLEKEWHSITNHTVRALDYCFHFVWVATCFGPNITIVVTAAFFVDVKNLARHRLLVSIVGCVVYIVYCCRHL